MSKKKLVMLAVLDGFGLRKEKKGNAIIAAQKPNIDYLFKTYPHTTLGASGEDVGLPEGQMGNSEVGHLNIGAGRVVFQSLTRVNISVRDEVLDKMPAINEAFEHATRRNSKLHIMGLLSDGGVHSHINHIVYLIEKAVERGVKEVVVHAFLDGRDVPPKSAEIYFKELTNHSSKYENVKVGVVSGRYYAMDRDRNYNRTQLAYDALVHGVAPVKDLFEGIKESYEKGVTDEFVLPYIVNKGTNISEHDAVIFANFRPDRAIQISLGITNPSQTAISGTKEFADVVFVSMMLYSEAVKGLVNFDLQHLEDMYGTVIAEAGLKQLRIAETEKYAHVTYFFDGGVEKELDGATRILVPSPKVATYDMQPEMSAYEVTDKVVAAILSEKYDTIILNFANCDMVGHTAVFDAAVKAVEAVDACIGRVYQAVKKVDGTLLITSDHGNADQIFDEDGNPYSAHTTNPVPLLVTRADVLLKDNGNLGDITPTMLELLDVVQPEAMSGKTMIKGYKK